MANPTPQVLALASVIRKNADGGIYIDEPSLERFLSLLSEGVKKPGAGPMTAQIIDGLGLMVEKLGPSETLGRLFRETSIVLAPIAQKLAEKAMEQGSKELEQARPVLAELTPEPTGEKVEPKENIPLDMPKPIKG